MGTELMIIIATAVALAVLAVVILLGKGDSLIAGYNTASRSERKRYDVRRVRLVVGIYLLTIVLMLLVWALLVGGSPYGMAATVAFPVAAFVLTLIALLLANGWARKR